MQTKKSRKSLIGQTFTTNKCGLVIVLEKLGPNKIKIKFLNTGSIKEVQPSNLVRGLVFDRTLPSNAGLGFANCDLNGEHWAKVWDNMLHRVANKSNRPLYNNCSIASEWLQASNFRDWYLLQPGHENHNLQLESDIIPWLTNREKCYSPETSFLCSRSLNHKMGCYLNAIRELDEPKALLPASIFLNSAGGYELKLRNQHIAVFANLEDAKIASRFYRTRYMLEDIISDQTTPEHVMLLAKCSLRDL